ncbi:MAG: hypothetical protein GY701_30110 [Sulfitobacter sp.]|nr:hypothetical protein [Sulfitobacter sp.]
MKRPYTAYMIIIAIIAALAAPACWANTAVDILFTGDMLGQVDPVKH